MSGTNYEIGYRLGELVANMPEIIEGQINKSNLVPSKSEIGAIIYEDIRNEMQSLIYNYHEEGTMMMFFLAMNADL
ncbi:hypothetical protein ACTPD5_21565, partial [Clostridioides difficile]